MLKLSEKLARVEGFVKNLDSDIAITRRKAYKTEEEMAKVEKEKKQQDYLLDKMNEQVKFLNEQLALYEAQIDTQRNEIKTAAETLAEATAEIEAINFEKKQLIQQWKSSLIGMQRRDEALKDTEQGLQYVMHNFN